MHPEAMPGQAPGLPQPGHTLGGKYEVVRLLGEGGMAFVYEASHQKLQQRVAIKMLTPDFARDPELVRRFEREARAVAKLRTPHVARVMDVDVTPEGIPYIVMEFLEGRDLDAELAARVRIPLDEAVDIVLQACAGMQEAHGLAIVHRDLKPANLFLAREGDAGERVVKVLDFGISKVVGEATRLTVAGAVMGTVMYMSPEQVRAQPNVDTRADIWALGVILYELVAGRAPWEGHSHKIAAAIVSRDPPDIRSFAQVPEAFATVLSKMLQREPENRYANVRELAQALAQFAPPGSIGANVAEMLAMGSSSVNARRVSPSMSKHTVPMASRPGGALELAALSARASMSPGAKSTAPLRLDAAPPTDATSQPRGRAGLVIAVLLGLLVAAAVVVFFVERQRRLANAPVAGADDAAAAIAKSIEPPASAPPPSAVIAPVLSAAPPSTGTSPRLTPLSPSALPSGKRSGKGGSSTPPPGSSVAAPPLTL